MKIAFYMVLGCILANPAFAGDRHFIERWKNYDEQIQVPHNGKQRYDKMIRKEFGALTEYDGELSPPAAAKEIERVLVLYSQENMAILLATPKNSMKDMVVLNEEYRRASMKCKEDRSWIVLLPENEWSEIELNPYCAMGYDDEDIYFDLYWTGSTARPIIDIITNGLTCVPHRLYGWDRKKGRYEPVSMKCTGLKDVEGYAGTGSGYEQLQQLQ